MSKKTKTLRISDDAESLLKQMAKKRTATESAILDEAIRLLAKKEKITTKSP